MIQRAEAGFEKGDWLHRQMGNNEIPPWHSHKGASLWLGYIQVAITGAGDCVLKMSVSWEGV